MLIQKRPKMNRYFILLIELINKENERGYIYTKYNTKCLLREIMFVKK